MMEVIERIKGCLLGLAVGDALGYPIEFLSLNQIQTRYGEKGITGYVSNRHIHKGMISDDTQMSIATAAGCISAFKEYQEEFVNHITESIDEAYQDWLYMQETDVRSRRTPGNTCLSALRNPQRGTLVHPMNHSKGCGAVMRSAPLGLILPPQNAFDLGTESGVLTHGHPSGYLPAGFLSMMVSLLNQGVSITKAIYTSFIVLDRQLGSEESASKLSEAVQLAMKKNNTERYTELGIQSLSDEENIEQIGEGWTGEEALAIALYAALRYPDNFAKAVLLSVNHSGDSDSTGCICGAIMGTHLGFSAIPEAWVKKNEMKSSLMGLAETLEKLKKVDIR